MYKNRRNKNHNNWNNNQQKNNGQKNNNVSEQPKQKKFEPSKTNYEDESVAKARQNAIVEIKNRQVLCAKCGQPISDISSALSEKSTGNPVHFECVLKEIESKENLSANEKVAYIGQGRFGVLFYENIRDQRHFSIKKIIEWEDRDTKASWREELSDLYSKVN
mgnify:CR=1 FL=1